MSLGDRFDEFYTIVKTVELVTKIGEETEQLRIEVLDNGAGNFSTRAYIKRDIKAEFVYPSVANLASEVQIWVAYDLPWTSRDSADGALQQALSFVPQHED